ncbi:MAG: IPT/TIG domain-containing protein [Polyangiaceae bacterium]
MNRRTFPAFGLSLCLLQACVSVNEDRGESSHVQFGEGARGGTGGSSGGTGGSGAVTHGPPQVTSMTPTEGVYGSEVTILGGDLGSAERSDVQLVLGGGGEVVISPTDEQLVTEWSEDQVRFRFAFPAEGQVALETPEGAVLAGDFKPSWLPGAPYPIAPGASVVASVAAGNVALAVVLDTSPPTLTRFTVDGRSEASVSISAYREETLRLYLGETSEVEGFALSDSSPPEIIQLDPDGSGGLVAKPTGLLVSEEFALAGGSNGAVVWYAEDDMWSRARPGTGTWTIDKGPIADPNPTAPDHAAGATSDGSLWLARSVDSGSFLDDMERPMCRVLGPNDTSFGSSFACGISMDDYITSLEFFDRGRGTVVRYCGSDVDPWGLSDTDYLCYTALLTPDGGGSLSLPDEKTTSRYAFTDSLVVGGICDRELGLQLTTDPASDPGETALWPCPELDALEIDSAGDFVFLVRHEDSLYFPRRRTTP